MNNKNFIANKSVIATEINDGFLILKDENDGQTISWPINSLPSKLKLGNRLNLTLKYKELLENKETILNKEINKTSSKEKHIEEEEKRKLLEKLIN